MSALGKVAVYENPLYKKSGLKSYAWVLAKYSITPTKKGPLFRGAVSPELQKNSVRDSLHQRFHPSRPNHVGRLMKRNIFAATDSEPRQVTTEDIQTDSLYLSEVQIGNPPQQFRLDFDSGSSDLWVFGNKLKSKFPHGDTEHHFFDTSGSEAVPGAKFEIHFGDGSWAKGKVVKDDLSVGGITVKGQAIEIAEAMDQSFVSGAGDGLLGLAFGKLNSVTPQQVKTPVENMIAQKDISQDQELFTCKLGSWKDQDEPDRGESFYTFGYIDQATVTATGDEIFYTPVFPDSGWWQFASTSATVNGSTISRPGNMAIADTGTTLALIDDKTAEAIYKAIPGAKFDEANQGWVYPAETTESQLPVVTLAVGGKQFTIQKEDLGFNGFKDTHGKSWVYGGIQSRGDNEVDVLGDTFLKGIYAIFDLGGSRFGAVQRKELHQNLQVPTSE